MSKSIGKVVGSVMGSGNSGRYGSEQEILNYLNNYSTKNYDNSADNMSAQALSLSQSLNSRPGYVYNVDGSDAARQRMEQSVYQQAVSRFSPQFEERRSDLESRLQNQGLAIGSEAYQRAVKDLEQEQNDALTNAAYQSVQAGQSAFSNSLGDAVSAGNFVNSARQYPVEEILSLLSLSQGGYDVAMDKYNIASGINSRRENATQSGWNNLLKLVKK